MFRTHISLTNSDSQIRPVMVLVRFMQCEIGKRCVFEEEESTFRGSSPCQLQRACMGEAVITPRYLCAHLFFDLLIISSAPTMMF